MPKRNRPNFLGPSKTWLIISISSTDRDRHDSESPEAETRIDSIREELYDRRRSLALSLEAGRIASFLKMTITEVRAPGYSRVPVPENESSDEFHERWKLASSYEEYKFKMGWHNPADFNPSRSRSERDRASELSQDLRKALSRVQIRVQVSLMDPQMRKIVSGLPDVWFKLLCHRGCTGKPSDQGRSVNRALSRLADIPPAGCQPSFETTRYSQYVLY
jgi:hypothetical protein